MNAVNFFSPVYIVASDSKLDSKTNQKIFFKERVINFAEATFAIGKTYQISKIDLKNSSLVNEYKQKPQKLTTIIRCGVIAVFVLILPLAIIPISLFFVKLLYRQNYQFNVQNETTEDSVKDDQDAKIAKQLCENELLQLKENGYFYNKFQEQIAKINRDKDSQTGTALFAHLSAFQTYYATMIDDPNCKNLNDSIYEAIESIGRLKSNINYKIRGIGNVGNSCYINSAMQALLTIPEINSKLSILNEAAFVGSQKQIVVAIKKFVAAYNLDFAPEEELENAAEEMQQALLNAGLIFPAQDKREELEATIQALEEMGIGDEENVALEEMKAQLAVMKAAGKNYAIKSQGDPIDLINKVLELIGDTIPLTQIIKPPIRNDIAFREEKNSVSETTIRIGLNQKDPSFKRMLENYFKPRIEGRGRAPKAFKLESGGQEMASRWAEELRIKGQPPSYLIVQLNRLDVENRERKRLNDPIDLRIGETFDLSKYLENPKLSAMYEACAVISHKGDAHQGHYYAIRKDAEANWYECNDIQFNKLSKQETEYHLGQGSIFILQLKKPLLEIVPTPVEDIAL